MNNKGYTLIELIVTLTLMILVGLVITANMTGMFSKEEDKSIENFKQELEGATCALIESIDYRKRCRSGCIISINELITSGYVDQDMKDPRTGVKVKDGNYSVSVVWNNNVKSCVLND